VHRAAYRVRDGEVVVGVEQGGRNVHDRRRSVTVVPGINEGSYGYVSTRFAQAMYQPTSNDGHNNRHYLDILPRFAVIQF
jgi:hypothetical protein